ncbi:LysR family transcriptional regulator [Rodentibacter trehalosifermentans]|uniref:LysR family transcriptional regulator n=1 Tax=Rodentibacter trehalosifermentans TaxID=1908263 RepID=UPI000987747A|nr:LysR family transcriptional regulator [Rodentibacter trehalosifermentans]OOF48118.1 hypothetical protein BKK53_10230 [Rodentibacter trehalosifermentans]
MNKLEILRIFCSVAETLHFRETANRLALSPQVVSRAIGTLEKTLGEVLFQRSTRQVKLTDFGEAFLPQAQQLIADAERLFSYRKSLNTQEIAGIVRIAVPEIPLMQAVLEKVLTKAAAYPDLRLHWQARLTVEDVVNEQIDVGFRFGMPDDNRLIIRQVGLVEDCIVASPGLLERLGTPKDWLDLKKNYPLSALFNPNTGRPYVWYLSHKVQFIPSRPKFTATRIEEELIAVRQAQTIAFLPRFICTPYLKTGELVELFPEIARKQWAAYVYRPYRNVTHPRVKIVFDWLVESIEAILEEKK